MAIRIAYIQTWAKGFDRIRIDDEIVEKTERKCSVEMCAERIERSIHCGP